MVWLMGMRAMGGVLSKKLFPASQHAELRQTFVERWAGNDKRSYLAALRSMIGWSVVSRLKGLACRTLIVSADHDYTPVSAKEMFVERMPNARLAVVSESHHALPAEKPVEFNRVVLEFLLEKSR
jgi:pimeloyl-ACP methyl ester carboxylesterase